MKKPLTPTNLIMGFLGAGKTTAILGLLSQKPADETWAVLVNEFGQIGIDGAIYEAHNAVVRELPGGCLCCALGLPFQVTVNRILTEIKPDRLIIEPTGLGHPKKILDQLTSGYFQQTLDVRASICLVDPRNLTDARYTGHANFVDQIALSDVLVANKMDLADAESIALFHQWVGNSTPRKSVSSQTRQGRLSIDWLELPRHSARSALFPDAHRSTVPRKSIGRSTMWPSFAPGPQAPDYRSEGKVFPAGSRFSYQRLYALLASLKMARIKAVAATDQGWFIFNSVDGCIDCMQIQAGQENRIEILDDHHHSSALWTEINQCLLKSDPADH